MVTKQDEPQRSSDTTELLEDELAEVSGGLDTVGATDPATANTSTDALRKSGGGGDTSGKIYLIFNFKLVAV